MRLFIVLIAIVAFVISCGKPAPFAKADAVVQLSVDSAVSAVSDIDSLIALSHKYVNADNRYGVMASSRRIGVLYRNKANFTEAIVWHLSELQAAFGLGDTLSMALANNNIGTNYRRLGILDEASTYHFNAVKLIDNFSGNQSDNSVKCRIAALNGIGNIFLTMNDLTAADSLFRIALEGEKRLGSYLGQAINYANIGSIFEKLGNVDSARCYYVNSLMCNERADSDIGRALCFNYLGRLHETEHEWAAAHSEYLKSYAIMSANNDRWHWLESCISLARVDIEMREFAKANRHLREAERTALEIRSWEHMGAICDLYYQVHNLCGNYKEALAEYKRSRSYADSVLSDRNYNHILDLRLNYEKENGQRRLQAVRHSLVEEKQIRQTLMWGGGILCVLFVLVLALLWYVYRMKQCSQQAMQSMEKARLNFFTNIIHEFRTPLTIVLGLADKLSNDDFESKRERADVVHSISQHGANLLELINQLLDVSKISSEAVPQDWRSGNIVEHVESIVSNYRVYAMQKGINVVFVSRMAAIECHFVPSYIGMIMQNLLSNALKFTPHGGRVEVTVNADDKLLRISMSDTGVGMDADELSHIFDLFYQASSRPAGVTGTGIGLALVKKLVDELGGFIAVESKRGEGTSFALELPRFQTGKSVKPISTSDFAMSATADMNNEPSSASSPDDTKPIALVVDDISDMARYIGFILGKQFNVVYATNGAEAMEQALQHVPDIIITDIMMPGIDGYELCRKIRESEVLAHIPIIVQSARCTDADKVRGYEAGADAFITKPFGAAELKQRVQALIEKRQALQQRYATAHSQEPMPGQAMEIADNDFVARFNKVVETQMAVQDMSVDDIAEAMCMSVSQLNRKVKSLTGFTTSNYVMNIKLEKAKRDLALTDTPISDIATACGFADASHFSRVFKQTIGMTPTEYRRSPKSPVA